MSASPSLVVLIVDGNLEHDAHAWSEIGLFGEKRIRIVTVLGLIKCLTQLK